MVEQLAEVDPIAPATRALMLRTALAWQAKGKINQAIDVYTQIITRFPSTTECGVARERLLAQAQDLERRGCYRLAMSLYDKLERLA